MTLFRRSIAAIFLLASALPVFAETTLIHAGQLLAVPGQSPSSRQTVVIENDRIVAVRSGYTSADEFDGEVTVIDLSRQFVLPGLMDMHVHLQGELGPNNDSDALKMSDQLMQMRSLHFAMNTLLAGFTTVRDVGSSPQEMYAMRDAIENGWIDRATGTGQQMEADELREVVLAAARMGKKVAIMAVESDFMSPAIKEKAV